MKKSVIIGLLILMLSVSLVIAGQPNMVPATVNPSNGRATVIIPEHAIEVAPGVFSLGIAVDNGRIVEGYAIIDYKERKGKPTCNNNGVCEPELGEKKNCADCKTGNGEEPTSSCYAFMAKGAKWKSIEQYIVDPTNSRGLGESFVRSNLASDIGKWETAAGKQILGNENLSKVVDRKSIVGIDGVYDPGDGDLNGENEVIFADIYGDDAIGVTIVWGIWYGPPRDREIVEWDQVYNQVDFDWGICDVITDCIPEGVDCELTPWLCKMDFENIATHELGHSVGMDHPSDSCTEETMYRFATEGETKKRTLEAGDKTGIKKLYS